MRVGAANLSVPYGTTVTAEGKRLELMPPAPAAADREALETALRAWRAETAKRAGVSAFVVLHDKHLQSIVERNPRTLAELAAVPGHGADEARALG